MDRMEQEKRAREATLLAKRQQANAEIELEQVRRELGDAQSALADTKKRNDAERQAMELETEQHRQEIASLLDEKERISKVIDQQNINFNRIFDACSDMFEKQLKAEKDLHNVRLELAGARNELDKVQTDHSDAKVRHIATVRRIEALEKRENDLMNICASHKTLAEAHKADAEQWKSKHATQIRDFNILSKRLQKHGYAIAPNNTKLKV